MFKNIFLITAFGMNVCLAQNLVQNGSFEDYLICPSGPSEISQVVSWSNTSFGTPDYFNACSADAGVPASIYEYQQSYSGFAYAGMYVLSIPLSPANFSVRENIQASFSAPLLQGMCYHFQMFANLGDSSDLTIDEIGIYFSDTSIFLPIIDTLPFIPQIVGSLAGANTTGWLSVTGDYTAHGGESFLVIGNFASDRNTNYHWLYGQNTAKDDDCYMLVDDVWLTLCAAPCPSISISYTTGVATSQLNNGATRVLASGGEAPYRYSLDSLSFQADNTFTSLAVGAYQIYVTDNNGCTAQSSFMIDAANCCPTH